MRTREPSQGDKAREGSPTIWKGAGTGTWGLRKECLLGERCPRHAGRGAPKISIPRGALARHPALAAWKAQSTTGAVYWWSCTTLRTDESVLEAVPG